MTAVSQINAGSRLTASMLRAVAPDAAIKGGDQTVTSSTTLVNDGGLFVSVAANASYVFQVFLDYEGGTQGSSDIKYGWSVPSGTTMRYTDFHISTGGTATAGGLSLESTVTAAGTNGSGNKRGVFMNGSVVTAGTAGTLQLQWAQNTSSGTGTIVHAQSYLALWQVA
jgi:hypothetical protein